MKKKTKIMIAIILIFTVLFVPVPSDIVKDGGTRFYTALTYKVAKWKVMIGVDYVYDKTSIYWFPDNFKSYNELWELETQ